MFKRIRGFFSSDLSIDLGTANTLIYMKNKGIILNEPSVIAIKKDKLGVIKSIAAVGYEAKLMLGRTPINISAIKPMQNGVIEDFSMIEKMLQFFFKKIYGNNFMFYSPRVLVSVPIGSTQVEKKAIKESALNSGAREVFLVSEPMSAAIGAGLPVSEATGSMVINIGGGITEVAIIALNGIVYYSSVKIGGDKFNEAIINYVRCNYGSLIGEFTAEKVKHEIGSAYPSTSISEMEVKGIDMSEGVPKNFVLNSNEILEAFKDPLSGIINSVLFSLGQCPPELSSDILSRGIYLTGGGALLKNLDRLLLEEVNVPIILAEDPLTCVARGGSKALDMIDYYGSELFGDDLYL